MRSTTSLPRSRRGLSDAVDRHWFRLLLGGSALVVGVVTLLQFWAAPFYINKDSALFQHAGWSILNGAELYVDIWDLKPPLIYFVTVVLAAVSFGDMAVLHVLSVIVAVAAVVAGITLVGVLTHRLTDDGVAAILAAGSMLVLTSLYGFPYAGIRPKYLAFCCGVGALVLAVDDRPFVAGGVGAMAAGFWQLGAPIALLVVGMSAQRGGWDGLWRAIGGGATVTVLTVVPFVAQGNAVPLFVETVLAPLYGVEGYTIVGRLLRFVIEIGYGVAIVPLAVAGWGLAVADRDHWWVAVGGGLYLFQLFLEFQGAIELVLLFVFLAVGVGLLVAEWSRPSSRAVIAGCVVLLIVTSGYWNLHGVVGESPEPPGRAAIDAEYDRWEVPKYDSLPDDPEGWPSMETIYWEKRQPDQCHYRLGLKQQYFEQETGGSLYKSTCGQWPFAEPPAEWLAGAVLPG
ncbi:DolP-mannose mannosyltransferase [Halohasta salina]|uniref:DolP-mannose mannosyltransferase n=1 Tax=Halohasta salina TaxID=2961621 RepID=UPI0020A39C8D|nr:DolP-mannose mannosyltransferase [Halohasta salina]